MVGHTAVSCLHCRRRECLLCSASAADRGLEAVCNEYRFEAGLGNILISKHYRGMRQLAAGGPNAALYNLIPAP